MRAIRKYEVVNEVRGSTDYNQDVNVDAGVYKMRVSGDRIAEIDKNLEEMQKYHHY